MKEYLLNETYTLYGRWYFVNKKDKQFFGQVIYSDELSIPAFKFWLNENIELSEFSDKCTIYGNLDDGTPITLLRVHFKSAQSKVNENNFFSCECDILGSIIIGQYFSDIDEIEISQTVCGFSGLPNLQVDNSFSSTCDKDLIQINYKNPKSTDLCEYKGLTYKIVPNCQFKIIGKQQFVFEKINLEIESVKLLSYDKVINAIEIFNNFLIYKINKRSHITYISFLDATGNVCFLLNYCYKKKELQELNQGMASSIMFDDNKTSLSEQYKKWLILFEQQPTAMYKYFYILSIEKYYIQERFLVYMQVLEDFYRHSEKMRQYKYENASLDEGAISYNSMVSAILENCPDKYRDWLSDKLQIENEIDLGTRLQEVFKKFDKVFRIYLAIGGPEKSNLITKIVSTRNYLTHKSEQAQKKAFFDLRDISIVTKIVETMINCMVLYEMDYSIEVINQEIYKKECFYSLIEPIMKKNIDWNKLSEVAPKK